MNLERLEHFLVLTTDLDGTRDFYVDVLGLEEGPRPPFKFAGYWLYLGDQPVVHLALSQGDPALQDYFREAEEGDNRGNGPIDHAAFRAAGLDEFAERLERHDIAHTRRTVPLVNVHQFFLHDPNGVKLEINFDPAELGEEARKKYEDIG